MNEGKVCFLHVFIHLYTRQIHPTVLKNGRRHATEIDVYEEYITKQFAPACISVGKEDLSALLE